MEAGYEPLSENERKTWHALKLIGEWPLSAIEGTLVSEAGLSGAEFGVLTRLIDLGDGKLLQADLLLSLGWEKSRLSHLLSRMETAGRLARSVFAGNRAEIWISEKGRHAVDRARPIHAAAVRKHVLSMLTEEEARVLLTVSEKLRKNSST